MSEIINMDEYQEFSKSRLYNPCSTCNIYPHVKWGEVECPQCFKKIYFITGIDEPAAATIAGGAVSWNQFNPTDLEAPSND